MANRKSLSRWLALRIVAGRASHQLLYLLWISRLLFMSVAFFVRQHLSLYMREVFSVLPAIFLKDAAKLLLFFDITKFHAQNALKISHLHL